MTQAEIFKGYMKAAWDGTSDDNDWEYTEDALQVADALGAKPAGRLIEGDDGNEFLFPDGSTAHIIVRDTIGGGFF